MKGVVNKNYAMLVSYFFFFFQAEDGIRDPLVTGVQTWCSSDLVALRIFLDGSAHDAGTYTTRSNEQHQRWASAVVQHCGQIGVCRRMLELHRVGLLDLSRSEERRVGKECRSRGSQYHSKKKSAY